MNKRDKQAFPLELHRSALRTGPCRPYSPNDGWVWLNGELLTLAWPESVDPKHYCADRRSLLRTDLTGTVKGNYEPYAARNAVLSDLPTTLLVQRCPPAPPTSRLQIRHRR